jgi:putative DNA primase/helicase
MYGKKLLYINKEPYSYLDGHWPMLNEQVDVAQVIANYLEEKVSKNSVAELLNLVQIFQAKTERSFAPNMNLICLLNGTLKTRTGELIDHSHEHNLRSQINCEWNPHVDCKRWLQFLDEIFVDDADKIEKIQLLQDWFGYCLVPDNSQQKLLWLVGGGGNGKSVLLEILTHLVGHKNISNAHIERLGDKFVRAELEGKLINISAEMGAEATVSDGYLKTIVSGEDLEAERKFKPSFTFKPYVRLIGSTNHLPRLQDLSDGFFRRTIILTFNRKFTDDNRDPKLIAKLLAELPGILAWAVNGLKNLRERGYFVIPTSSIDALVQYRKDSDPERMFFDECLVLDPTGKGMLPNDIYAGYVAWCKASGHRAKASNNFGKRLSGFGIDSYRGNSGKRWLVTKAPGSQRVWNDVDIDFGHYENGCPDKVEPVSVQVTPDGFKI